MKKSVVAILIFCCSCVAADKPVIRVGSKSFTESYVLSEILTQIIEDSGEATVERKFGLGQTGIAFEALQNAKIDLYTEYTGTISEAILKNPALKTVTEVREALQPMGLTISDSLGFNNTYALAVTREVSEKRNLRALSELKNSLDIHAGFSHEFLERPDCYPRVREVYQLKLQNVKGLAHSLAYEAISKNEIEMTDIYSTDAKVRKFGLVVLKDDRHAFPDYLAVIFARANFAEKFPKTWKNLTALVGKITNDEMIQLNAKAELDAQSFSKIAATYLGKSSSAVSSFSWATLWTLTQQHLFLVMVSLAASIVVALPLAIAGARVKGLGQAILALSGVIQTIPSLALLCFLIPLFGIGNVPALVALFLYGLLPIVRSTYVGLTTIDPRLREVAKSLALTPVQQLVRVELPLASPSILSGIKTSAIINVGTATLAALIGAGGYGVPIVTGLALNDIPTILQGAIPAAVLALVLHGLFEGMDRMLIPRGLRA